MIKVKIINSFSNGFGFEEVEEFGEIHDLPKLGADFRLKKISKNHTEHTNFGKITDIQAEKGFYLIRTDYDNVIEVWLEGFYKKATDVFSNVVSLDWYRKLKTGVSKGGLYLTEGKAYASTKLNRKAPQNTDMSRFFQETQVIPFKRR